ncbi:MAG: UDP-N-acetylmuramate dehydrogenase, partial [Bacteroidota bacterium]
AAPVQNIGAYGVELKDVFVALRAFDLQSGTFRQFDLRECDFGYRHSLFKQADVKGRYLITKVQLELTTANHHLNTNYGAISTLLEQAKVDHPTPADIARAVIEIRRSKLPDWRQLGNAGSFFKNPIIPMEQYQNLRQQLPDVKIPAYPAGEDKMKLAAGWLIDQCGWKGKRNGPVGCYEKQALVIVNHGGATAKDILALSQQIVADVQHKFGVQLEREVNAIFSE